MNSGYKWIGIVVGLLATSLIAQVILLVVASSDPAFAIEPDYERRARNWDVEQRQQSVNRALGWTVDLRTQPTIEDGGFDVAVVLSDRSGAAITGAEVSIEGFANARAGQVYGAPLVAGTGGYVGHLAGKRPGLWEFRVTVAHGDKQFTKRIRKEVLTGYAKTRMTGR